ncbi:Rieske (2Fe-2S) protein [Amycolatopsis balhimycina DSM 5908]|uniref:Rieske (2Fe-2S) protein n=1 Tax=Amycolatopsis balhimycina DSM 5908 TaxID=1081091 RepID=A0A428WRR5_AMYBA|nr:Rieske (2Fe-2S) protein [Amycolatopsis balhimycina]RSM45772.1 Rieske (2Fe-2S) protein [Amycolatopsis balhimycina DSM 5908]
MNDVDRFADSLLGQRTPEPFRPDDEQVAQMRAAIELQAVRLGAADAHPPAGFLARLERELAAELTTPATPLDRRATRRRVVRTAGIAAASLAAGVGIDRLVRGPAAAPPEQEPGEWRTVAASKDVPEGGLREFELDTVTGFVQRTPDGLQAVSSTCTHLGCRLRLANPERRLVCPCHGATFALTGEIVRYDLPVEIPPLPVFEARDQDGDIQIYTPFKRD